MGTERESRLTSILVAKIESGRLVGPAADITHGGRGGQTTGAFENAKLVDVMLFGEAKRLEGVGSQMDAESRSAALNRGPMSIQLTGGRCSSGRQAAYKTGAARGSGVPGCPFFVCFI